MKGRVLGIDYGGKRIGLALSDPMRIIASPHDTLVRTELKADLEQLAAVIDEYEVTALVIGQPNNTDGSAGEMVRRVEAFVAALVELRPLPVHWIDETYTSLEADALLRQQHKDWKSRKAKVDKVAAQLILRTYLASEEG